MAFRYVYLFDSNRSREYFRLRGCVRTGAKNVHRDANWITYHVGIEGQSVGRARSFSGAKKRARDLVRSKPVGTMVRIITKKHGDGPPLDVIRFVKVETLPPVKDGPGVEGIDRAESFVQHNFPNARFAGDCVCKQTTFGTHSDHADCAAVDYFDTVEHMDQMRGEFLKNAEYYHTKYVILGSTITYPGRPPQNYSGVYHSHIHLSVYGGVYNKAC